jgi:hypothetical protein
VVELGVIVTDHDWRIEHISNDVHALLGYDPPPLDGTAFLGYAHPDDAFKILHAINASVTSRQAAVARVWLRAADGSWRELSCFITPLCEHRPPRPTVLLSAPGSVPAAAEATRAEELEQHLSRIAMEVRAAGLVRDVNNVLPVDRTREFSELSGRQLEIATRLVNGQRVPEIARSMRSSC